MALHQGHASYTSYIVKLAQVVDFHKCAVPVDAVDVTDPGAVQCALLVETEDTFMSR